MPESLFNSEDIRITDLLIDKRERVEPLFDAEEEIDEATWSEMVAQVKAEIEKRGMDGAQLSLASNLVLIFPERRGELDIQPDNTKYVEQIFKEMDEPESTSLLRIGGGGIDENVRNQYIRKLEKASILLPDAMRGHIIPNWIKERIKNLLERFIRDKNWEDLAITAKRLTIASPELLDPIRSTLSWDKFAPLLDPGHAPEPDHWKADDYWCDFPLLLAALKVLFPVESKGVKLTVSQWENILRILHIYKEDKHWPIVAQTVADLKMFTADAVHIGPNGITINPRSELVEDIPQQPVQRSY
jgi:hypothetical protein